MIPPLVRAVTAHLNSIFTGPNGDYPPLLDSLAGLTAAQAAWKPAPGKNSIWQIVDHLTASNVWGIDMFEKGSAGSPVWTEPEVSDAGWQRALEALNSTHARLKAAMDKYLSDENLLEFPDPTLKQTMLELVLSTACAHLAYHAGQIDYLRGLQGV
jgi:uncharacterized damage-inducible protein DinB